MKKILILVLLSIFAFQSKAQINPLIFNFDTIESVYIDTNLVGNVWQIGVPQKLFFNGAFSAPNVIITDTINSYPINNTSEFTVKTPTYIGGWGGVIIRFTHKFDTDTLIDGGTILVSGDGLIWENIINSPAFSPFTGNYFGPTDFISSLNDVGFSGNSNGWQQTYGFWNYPPTDTLWIKFKFASDGLQTNKEGWMIDDLRFEYNLGISVKDVNIHPTVLVKPNPANSNSKLFIECNEFVESLYIFNESGVLIKQLQNINQKQVEILTTNLISGIYTYKLFINKARFIDGKFIIN